MKVEVDAIKFHQFNSNTPNDQLLIFSAPAKELAAWAGIPRKGWRIRMLFQRWIARTRETELAAFWTAASQPNTTTGRYLLGPSAIIVAMHGPADVKDGRMTLEYNSPIKGLHSDADKLKALATTLIPRIRDRFANDGESLEKLDEFYRDPTNTELPPVDHDYVLEFALQLGQMNADPKKFIDENKIEEQELAGLINSMEAICRPAVVVDGQHRLWGASTVKNVVNLPVVALPNCEWTDQIYQFVVINDKAQKVDGDLLNDIFASSLTHTERNQVRDDFSRVRVDIEKRIAGVLAGQDTESPFYQMVSLDLPDPPREFQHAYISQTIIQNLIDGGRGARGWRNDEMFFEKYVKPTCTDKSDWENWQNGRWKEYWFTFWKTVRDTYNPQAAKLKKDPSFELWSKSAQSNLTKGVGLKVFQSFFIEKMVEEAVAERTTIDNVVEELRKTAGEEAAKAYQAKKAPEKTLPATAGDFRNTVTEFLDKFPVNFFAAGWQTSLDDSEGQGRLLEAMREAYDNNTFRARGRNVFVS